MSYNGWGLSLLRGSGALLKEMKRESLRCARGPASKSVGKEKKKIYMEMEIFTTFRQWSGINVSIESDDKYEETLKS